jgi:hypothetical protein
MARYLVREFSRDPPREGQSLHRVEAKDAGAAAAEFSRSDLGSDTSYQMIRVWREGEGESDAREYPLRR